MDTILKNRFKDLANRSYQNSHFTFTDFLSLADISEFYEIEREVNFVKAEIFGGCEASERKIIRFGNPEDLGYEEPFPIVCLEIKPLNDKFADALSHRDFLGALMNLGIERETLGDIFVDGHRAYIFCLERISEYIIKNLTRIKHTSVMAKPMDGSFEIPDSFKEEKTIQISSLRVDAVVARTFNLSRDDSLELFREQKVFINGRLCTSNDTHVHDGDRVSVRGFGKFDVCGEGSLSRKQKINQKVLIYR